MEPKSRQRTTVLLATAVAIILTASSALAGITTRPVTFKNEGAALSGTLYLPADPPGARLPVVVVTGAWTSVEEQMPSVYARAMVERGFAAFTFDFRGWGKSGDLPGRVRFKEDPKAKISDIRAAIEFVSKLSEVDAKRINGLGICASSGYMVDAVSGNPLVSRVGLVAPWLQNDEIVRAVYGGDKGVNGLISVSRAAAAKGGEIIPAAGPKGAKGVLMPIGGYYHDPNRGAIPQYDNKWNQAGWEGWLTYHPAENPGRLNKPLAIVHSEAAAIPDGARRFYAGLGGAKEEIWLDDVTQFDFYYRPAPVETSSDAAADFFQRN